MRLKRKKDDLCDVSRCRNAWRMEIEGVKLCGVGTHGGEAFPQVGSVPVAPEQHVVMLDVEPSTALAPVTGGGPLDLSAQQREAMQREANEALELLAALEGFELDDEALGKEGLSAAHEGLKRYEGARLDGSRVVRARLEVWSKEFEPVLDALQRLKERWKVLLKEHIERERAQEKALVAEGTHEALIEASKHIPTTVPQIVRRYEIVDASLLPREYLKPDDRAIWETIRSGGEVPGVRAWTEETIRA